MKRNKIIMFVTIFLVLLITTKLIKNKSKIDKKNEFVDRSKIPVVVTTQKAYYGELTLYNSYPAVVKAQNEANIFAQASGILAKLNIELGQNVHKGQVLGQIDTKTLNINLQIAQAALNTAKLNKSKLYEDYKRAEDLYNNKAGTEINMINSKYASEKASNDYENALQQVNYCKQQIINANIVAPLSGTIYAKNSKEGEFINPNAIIGSIINTSSIKASAFVNQNLIYKLQKGQVVNVISSANSNWTKGFITYISPKADVNHNYQVDVAINDKTLKPGTDVTLSFESNAIKGLLIPKSAIVVDRKEPFVYVVEKGVAIGRNIQIGESDIDKTLVVSGLKENDEVVINGQINLFEGSKVKTIK